MVNCYEACELKFTRKLLEGEDAAIIIETGLNKGTKDLIPAENLKTNAAQNTIDFGMI